MEWPLIADDRNDRQADAQLRRSLAALGGFDVEQMMRDQLAARAAAAVQRANIPADQNAAGVMIGIYAVAWLVCLAPVFFMFLRRPRLAPAALR